MVEFKEVSKSYTKGNLALDNIDLKIEQGEFVFVIGESGAGKSTLIKLILKEENPDSGKIYLLGKDITKVRSRRVPIIRKQIGVVFQDFRLLENKTVYGNLQYIMQNLGFSRKYIKQEIPKLLESVKLTGKEKSYPHQLSGGEQQRVSIARALVVKPKIIIADEPTGNLDPKTSKEIADLLVDINNEGTTVIMITHESEIVDSLQKRVIELDWGKLVRDEDGGKYEKN